MPLIRKTLDELNTDVAARLEKIGYSDAQYKGTGVRNILEATNISLADLYDAMANNLEGNYLSTAKGGALDALGQLLNCVRRQGEGDGNYRFRIGNALQVAKTGNLQSLLQTLFALANIRDVIVRPFTHGVGSVTFYLIGVTGLPDANTIALAEQQLANVAAAGAYTVVLTPTPLLLNVQGTISVSAGANAASLRTTAQGAVVTYLANLSMGAPFVRAELDQVILDAGGGQITDFTLLALSTTDSAGITRQQLLRNYTPTFDQQLQPGTITIA